MAFDDYFFNEPSRLKAMIPLAPTQGAAPVSLQMIDGGMNSDYGALPPFQGNMGGDLPDVDYYGNEMTAFSQPPVTKNDVMETLGAKQPDAGGIAQDILASRFLGGGGNSIADYGKAFALSSFGKPTTGSMVAEESGNNMLKKLAAIAEIESSQARAALYRKGGTGTNGATVQIVERIMQENPGMTFDQALYQYQTGNRQNTRLTPSGVQPLPNALETEEAISGAKQTGQKRADVKVEKEQRLPGATSSVASTVGNSKNVFDAISRAKQQSGAFTTGFSGAVTKNIPGTPSYDLARTIETVKANIGFDKLQQMRIMSPTGGALGQVSDFENKLLQATIANLEQSQTREQFEYNLDRVYQQYRESMDRVREAYINDFGETKGFDALFSQVPQLPKTDASGLSPDEEMELQTLRSKYGR